MMSIDETLMCSFKVQGTEGQTTCQVFYSASAIFCGVCRVKFSHVRRNHLEHVTCGMSMLFKAFWNEPVQCHFILALLKALQKQGKSLHCARSSHTDRANKHQQAKHFIAVYGSAAKSGLEAGQGKEVTPSWLGQLGSDRFGCWVSRYDQPMPSVPRPLRNVTQYSISIIRDSWNIVNTYNIIQYITISYLLVCTILCMRY